MLVRGTKQIYRHKVLQTVGKDATGKEVLDYLFGDETDFVIREWCSDHKTRTNRLNMVWAVPFTIICAPVRFIMNGYVGWDTKTRLGRFILKVTGHLIEP